MEKLLKSISFTEKNWAHDSAKFICSTLVSLAHKQSRLSVMLTGGRCAKYLYEQLGKEIQFKEINGIDFYLGDERWVSFDDPESNYKMIMETLFREGVPGNCTFSEIKTSGLSMKDSVADYNYRIPNSIDLLLLGVGEDGHIASLFKNSKALKESIQKVVQVLGKKSPKKRISISPNVIQNAKSIYVLACNVEKVKIFDKVKSGIYSKNELPAMLAKNAIWLRTV